MKKSTLIILFSILSLTVSYTKTIGEYPKTGKVINSWEGELFPLINGTYWRYVNQVIDKDGKIYDLDVYKYLLISSSSYEYYKRAEKFSKEEILQLLASIYKKSRKEIFHLKKEQLLSLLIYNFEPKPAGPFYVLLYKDGKEKSSEGRIEIKREGKFLVRSTVHINYIKKGEKQIKRIWWGKYLPIGRVSIGQKWTSGRNSGDIDKSKNSSKWEIEYEIIGSDVREIGVDKFICYIVGWWTLSKKDGKYEKINSSPSLKMWIAPNIGIVVEANNPQEKIINRDILIEYYRPDKNFWWYTSEKIVPDIPPYVKGVDRRPYPRLTDD